MSERRDSRRDRDRDRSKSPIGGQRGPRREYDDQRGRNYENRGGGRGDGRGDGRRGSSDFDSGGHTSREEIFVSTKLPEVPDVPPIPPNSKEIPYPARPNPRGSKGEAIFTLANHFTLRTLPLFPIYCYDLAFRVPPESQLKGDEKLTAGQLARAHLQVMGVLNDRSFVFDGVSLGWSPKELCPVGKARITVLQMGTRRDLRPNSVDFRIFNRGPIDIRRLVQLFQTGPIPVDPTGDPKLEVEFKWLQAVFRHFPSTQMTTRPNSNSYFDSDLPKKSLESTGHVLEALRGIYQSVQLRFQNLTVNVDTATSVFWSPGRSLIQLVCAIIGLRSPDTLTEEFTSNPQKFFHACTRLVGVYFHIQHLPKSSMNSKKIRFSSWSTSDSYNESFEENGVSTTVFDYYKRKYDIILRFPKLPLVMNSGAAYPLELAFSCAGERYKGLLKGAETADLLKFATAPAYVRQRQIAAGIQKLAWHSQAIPSLHGLSVSTQMLELKARVLEPPRILYGGGQSKIPVQGRWDLRGVKFLRPCRIQSYVLLYIPGSGRPAEEQRVDQFARDFARGLNALGINVPSAPPILIGNPQGSAGTVLTDAVAKAQSTFKRYPDLVIVLTGSEVYYPAYKQELDCNLGIASQFLLEAKAMKPQRSNSQYIANCCMKVNSKLGGCNSIVDDPILRRAKTMIIGADLSLPPPSLLKLDPPPQATVAITGSWDEHCARFTAVVSMQSPSRANLIVNAAPMFRELLERYKEKQGCLPGQIIFYRDGASESEFETIKTQEYETLRQLCQEMGGKGCKIVLVMAIKNHHTRIFPAEKSQRHASKLGNVPPGTVVENSTDKNDIFLVAHTEMQGTKRPTRYITLQDEIGFSADEYQLLTFRLCSTYSRSTTTVSLVPAIYYAHQACARAHLYVQDRDNNSRALLQVHQNLKWNMWWQ